MANPKVVKTDAAAKPATPVRPKQADVPMDFLMANMHEWMRNAGASGPQRSDEEIEADFDNMPI